MRKDIIKAEDLPESEKVFMKKSLGEWNVVYPIKNEDGSINWFNLLIGGSWLRFFTIIVIILIILGVAYEFTSNQATCQKIINEINSKANIALYPSNMNNISYILSDNQNVTKENQS